MKTAIFTFAAIILTVTSVSVWAQEEVERVETNLVTMNVAVTDSRGNYVRGLSKSDFTLLDDGRPQEIDTFSAQSTPVSIGIVYDMHPSTDEVTFSVLDALKAFTKGLGGSDDYFVNVFSENGSLTTDFVPTRDQLVKFVDNGGRTGPTSLYDAVFAAANKVSRMKNPKKILLLLTDGADQNSQHSLKQLKLHFRSVNVPLYAVTFNNDPRQSFSYVDLTQKGPRQVFRVDERSGVDAAALAELSKTTGGQTFEGSLRNRYYLAALCQKVMSEISNQYVIGFYPDSRDNKWHRLSLAVRSPASTKYNVTTRRGYQSPNKP